MHASFSPEIVPAGAEKGLNMKDNTPNNVNKCTSFIHTFSVYLYVYGVLSAGKRRYVSAVGTYVFSFDCFTVGFYTN